MDAAITVLLVVFDAIAVLIIVLGLYMIVTGKDIVPDVLRARLRRVAATPRDQKVVGVASILGGIAILSLSVATATRAPLWDLASVVCLTGAIVLNLIARRVDRRENRVSSGWEDITRTFR